MSYKPDESLLMAYLYDELSGEERVLVEKYLLENPTAMKELESLQYLRKMMSTVSDKEVIAPPIVVEESKQRFLWNAPYFKTITSIAASLLLLMIAGKIMDVQVNYSGNEVSVSFGKPAVDGIVKQPIAQGLTAEEVQNMINSSMAQNNQVVQASITESQKKLDASISKNLAMNSSKINDLVQQASRASQDEIRQFVASLQNQNQELVKDYFQLSTSDQQKYIEGLLVDFSKYLQQQRNNDLETLNTRLTGLEQNATVFKQETEQILASIISNATPANTRKNY
ncbi:MAG TPA: hypothetical protein VFU05_14650 [Cyclobacteriaceae bacterium]|nr:hypothetical protein [Cyclobacteriaceae bacterium]